jgi:hypothetical protein
LAGAVAALHIRVVAAYFAVAVDVAFLAFFRLTLAFAGAGKTVAVLTFFAAVAIAATSFVNVTDIMNICNFIQATLLSSLVIAFAITAAFVGVVTTMYAAAMAITTFSTIARVTIWSALVAAAVPLTAFTIFIIATVIIATIVYATCSIPIVTTGAIARYCRLDKTG